MTSIQEGTQVPVTHVGQSHPAKTFNGSHPLNVFAEQPILNAWKGSGCQRHCQISEKGPIKIVYGSNLWYPPVNPCLYNPSVATNIGGLIHSTTTIKGVLVLIKEVLVVLQWLTFCIYIYIYIYIENYSFFSFH